MRLFQTAVPVRPENGFQVSRHIRSLVVQVCMLYRTHKQNAASGISHIRVIHICRVIDVLHVFERHEHVPLRREDRVVDVVHHPAHPIILLVEGTPQHFSQAVCRAEQLQSKRTAQHYIVIAAHHLPAVPADQRQCEEPEKVLPDHRYVSVHLPVVCFYHKPLIRIHGTPVLYLGIALLEEHSQPVMATGIILIGVNPYAVGILQVPVHRQLPCHHVCYQQHKHQRNTQPDQVDERKQLVAVEKRKISFQSFHVLVTIRKTLQK